MLEKHDLPDQQDRVGAPSGEAPGEPVRPAATIASRAVPLTVGACFFMEGLDATIIATSLPQIADALRVTPSEMGIALTTYLISVSMWMAASGWLADRFEARRVFIAAIALFVVGSMVCATSQSLAHLVVGRFVQGMGGAMMTPVGRLILARSFPRSELVRAMSWMIIPGLLGPMLGPVAGGWITTYLDWRWIFWINLPLGIVGIGLALRYLQRIPPGAATAFDWRGFALVALAMVAAQAGLEVFAAVGGVGVEGFAGLVIGVAAFAFYWFHARRPDPILDLTLFRFRAFAVAVLGGAISRVVLGATMFLFPLYFQLGLGATPVEAGYLMAVLALGQMALRLGIDPLLRTLGIRKLLVANSAVMALLLSGLLLFGEGSSLLLLGAFLFAFGMLHAVQLSTLGALNFSGIPGDRLGQATSLAAVMQRLAMAVGISCAAILLGHSSAGSDVTRTDFILPTLVLSGVLVLSLGSFLALRHGDGDDLLDKG